MQAVRSSRYERSVKLSFRFSHLIDKQSVFAEESTESTTCHQTCNLVFALACWKISHSPVLSVFEECMLKFRKIRSYNSTQRTSRILNACKPADPIFRWAFTILPRLWRPQWCDCTKDKSIEKCNLTRSITSDQARTFRPLGRSENATLLKESWFRFRI